MKISNRSLTLFSTGCVFFTLTIAMSIDKIPMINALAAVNAVDERRPSPSTKKPLKWLRLAAESGDSNAAYKLGRIYAEGDGVLRDYETAVEWYLMAAKMGHAKAQNNLGVRYDKGQGVPRDLVRAYSWFNLAAAQGHPQAKRNLSIIESQMTSEQIVIAKRLRDALLGEND